MYYHVLKYPIRHCLALQLFCTLQFFCAYLVDFYSLCIFYTVKSIIHLKVYGNLFGHRHLLKTFFVFITFDEFILNMMWYANQVFGRTVICRDLDVATSVARNNSLDCITLEGMNLNLHTFCHQYDS